MASSAVKSSAAKKASSSAKKSAGTPSSSKAPPAPAVEEAPSPPADDIPAPADEPPVVKKRGRPSNPNKPAAAEEPAVPKKRGRRSNADIAAAAAAGHPFTEPKKRAPKAPKVVDGEGDDEGEAEGEDEGPAKGKGKGKAKAQPKAKGKAPRKSKVASAEPEPEQEQDPGSREENGDKEQGEEVVPTRASGSEAAGRVAASEPDDDAMEIDQAPALNAYEFPANPVYNLNAEDQDINGRTYLGLERQFAAKEHDWEVRLPPFEVLHLSSRKLMLLPSSSTGSCGAHRWDAERQVGDLCLPLMVSSALPPPVLTKLAGLTPPPTSFSRTEGTSFSWIPNPIVRIRCPQRVRTCFHPIPPSHARRLPVLVRPAEPRFRFPCCSSSIFTNGTSFSPRTRRRNKMTGEGAFKRGRAVNVGERWAGLKGFSVLVVFTKDWFRQTGGGGTTKLKENSRRTSLPHRGRSFGAARVTQAAQKPSSSLSFSFSSPDSSTHSLLPVCQSEQRMPCLPSPLPPSTSLSRRGTPALFVAPSSSLRRASRRTWLAFLISSSFWIDPITPPQKRSHPSPAPRCRGVATET